MTFNRLLGGAAVAVAAVCFGAALMAADRESSTRFLEVTGFDVAITSMQGDAMSGSGIGGEDSEAFGIQWERLAEDVFEPDAMIEDALDMMEAIMPQELIDHGIEFYSSELGQRLVAAENAAQSADGAQMSAEGEDIAARLAQENPARLNEFELMMGAIGSTDASVRAIIEVQVRYLMSATAAGASDIRFSEAELRELLSEQAPMMAEMIEGGSIINAAWVYRDFSDEELVAYREALEAPDMKQVYEILNAIQYEIMAERYELLATKLAGLAPQVDL